MIRYHATWILPISGTPIRDSWVAVDRGRIVAYGAEGARVLPADGAQAVDLGNVAVMPGLVNAHTHLELSYLRDEVPPSSEFVKWVRAAVGSLPIVAIVVPAISRKGAKNQLILGAKQAYRPYPCICGMDGEGKNRRWPNSGGC